MMSDEAENTKIQLHALARHLSQPDSILDAWRALVKNDAMLVSSSHLTRTQFIDPIPRVIEALCARLRSWPEDDTPQQRQTELEIAKSHAQHRWQMGYNMRAIVREWGHLNVCLSQEIDTYGRHHADTQPVVLPEARQVWARLINDSIAHTTVAYHDLLQIESTARLNDLETVLNHMREMEIVRGQYLHSATHDLRGSLGVLRGATVLIGDEQISPPNRAQMCRILDRGIATLHQMLEELMDMARLESAQDPRCVAPFDVGEVLVELCDISQPLAMERGLLLKSDGPANLSVESDHVKMRRIAQNLLLNALKYTNEGEVSVTWEKHGDDKLLLCVQDTGPGLADGATVSHERNQGEGIGLSIVKRLCELLEAKFEVESEAGVGTKARVFFPLHYKDNGHGG